MENTNLIIMIILVLLLWKFLGIIPAIIGGVIFLLFKK